MPARSFVLVALALGVTTACGCVAAVALTDDASVADASIVGDDGALDDAGAADAPQDVPPRSDANACVGAGGQCVEVTPEGRSMCPPITECPTGLAGVPLSCGDDDSGATIQCCMPGVLPDASIPCTQAGGMCTLTNGSPIPCRLNCQQQGDNPCPPSPTAGPAACCFPTDACIPYPPRICVLKMIQCGPTSDGCGGTFSCGTCNTGQTCDAGTCVP